MRIVTQWLMEFVVESREYFDMLVYCDPAEGFDQPPSPFSRKEIVEGLLYLFEERLILAYLPPSGIDDEGFSLSQDQINDALDRDIELVYGLTCLGGSLLESMAEINWEKYFRAISFDLRNVEAFSINQNLLESWLSLPCFMDISVVVPGSQRWDTVENWQATYWKKFSVAHRVQYQCEQLDVSDHSFEYIEECLLIAEDWRWENANWYQPVDLSQC